MKTKITLALTLTILSSVMASESQAATCWPWSTSGCWTRKPLTSKKNELYSRLKALESKLQNGTTRVNKGDTGDTGDQGPIGTKGLVGDKGDTGIKGLTGDVGSQGAQGPKGDTGAAGGPVGPKGVVGDIGPQGDQGPQGNAGPQGPTGIAGIQGPTGNQGPIGLQGLTGTDVVSNGTTYCKCVRSGDDFKMDKVVLWSNGTSEEFLMTWFYSSEAVPSGVEYARYACQVALTNSCN